ncbi:methionyl-tRNA formyltransferase [Mycoplasmopsis columbinasalis]|uniref:Methionyl-tRNA formyltransferase n=1 Tax=Mycoplasmopsis columbinasalis TaxID=114880 RepID=A0A449B9K5_9BACT|nr:methionyl-tRNA formyltransferase [Mycoplasmopsis columbinasalis]VEU77870.1 Methionyl-tRNA formyltransferase [Mycoplasmopsis columbinasalis]
MIKILLAGTPEFAVPIFEKIIQNFHVVGIVSQPDRPANRGHKTLPTPTKLLAQKYNIPCFQPEKIGQIKDELSQLNYDYFITAAFGQFVPASILKLAKKYNLNVHGSLLPKYRGAAPIQHSLLNGDKITGISIMEMILEMDAGDVFTTLHYQIKPRDVASDVFTQLSNLTAQNIVEIINKINHGIYQKVPQESAKVTLAPKLLKEQAFLENSLTCEQAINKIRAFATTPGAYVLGTKGERIKIFFATTTPTKNAIVIKCADGEIYGIDYQYESRNRVILG